MEEARSSIEQPHVFFGYGIGCEFIAYAFPQPNSSIRVGIKPYAYSFCKVGRIGIARNIACGQMIHNVGLAATTEGDRKATSRHALCL